MSRHYKKQHSAPRVPPSSPDSSLIIHHFAPAGASLSPLGKMSTPGVDKRGAYASTPPPAPAPPPRRAFSLDSYTNPLASLGSASPLLTSGTYVRSFISTNFDLLTTLYRENWIAKKIIDMPSEDMTRAWYSLTASVPDEAMNALRRLEARHSVKAEITNAIRWARLYGGSLAVMVIRDQEDQLDAPLDPEELLPDSFQGLLVLDRTQSIEPSLSLVDDLDDPDFGLPEFYSVDLEGATGHIRIHHSRVLRFVGRELPHMEEVRENYWGASELEHIYEELQKRNATSANIAQLVFQANITTLKMADFGEILAMGTDGQRQRVLDAMEEQNRLRTSFGLQIMSAEDSLEEHPYSFGGLSEIYEEFMLDMAGASGIPATRLFGRSPQGMNATGESDLKNYYEMIGQMQERYLRPALEKLLPVMAMSVWGEIPDDPEILFEPLMTTSPSERAMLMNQFTDAIIKAYQAGILSREDALHELKDQGKSIGAYSAVSADQGIQYQLLSGED